MAEQSSNLYFEANPDVAAAYANRALDPNLASTLNMTPEQFAQTHYEKFGGLAQEGRLSPMQLATNAQATGALSQVADATPSSASGALAAPGIAVPADSVVDTSASRTISDYRGQTYDARDLLNLSTQVMANLNMSDLRGGAFGESGQSIGFGYDDAKNLLGRDLTTPEQVSLDMARNLMNLGITNLDQFKEREIRSDLPVSTYTDENGQTRYRINDVDLSTGEYVFRDLTPEEVAQMDGGTFADERDNVYAGVLRDQLQGYALDRPVGEFIRTGRGGNLSTQIGSTYTGPGVTAYQLNYNPETNKFSFGTQAGSTSDADAIGAALAFASFIPGVAPFAQAIRAGIAIDQGDILGGLASAAGIPGMELGNVATALNVANAIDKQNPFALVQSLANTSFAKDILKTDLGEGFKLSDAVSAAKVVDAVSRNDIGGALSAAANMSSNGDFKTASAAFNVVSAMQSGNPAAFMSAMTALSNPIVKASRASGNLSADAGDAGTGAFIAAVNAGATEDEAMELANTISGTQLASADAGTRSDAGDGATVEVSGVPIFAESREAANVRPPPGYELMSSSEMDARPSGAYYDNMLNAWLKPTGAFDLSFSPDDAASFDAGSLDSADIDAVGSDAYAGPYGGAGEEGFAPDTTVADTAYIDGGQGGAADQGDEEGMAPVTTVTDTPYVEEVQDEIPSEEEEGTAPETTVTDTPYVEEVQDEIVNEEEVATPPTTPAPPSRPPSPTTAPAPAPLPSVAPRVVIPTLTSMGFSEAEAASLAAQMLESKETQKALDPLAKVKEAQKELEREIMMQNRDPRLMEMLSKQSQFQKDEPLGIEDQQYEQDGSYYSYGSEQSIDDILNGSKQPAYKSGGYVAPLMAHGGMALPLLAKSGGALSQSTRGGREDFKDGKHVAGDGDGQSDDIPAWLADGEFVFPADVVSALGNGSTKAGTDKLYEMMHSIRDRARSKGSKDLPPPALKSPLDYLKSAKRSAR